MLTANLNTCVTVPTLCQAVKAANHLVPRLRPPSTRLALTIMTRSGYVWHSPTCVHSIGSFPKNFPAALRNCSRVSSLEGITGFPSNAIFFTAFASSFFSLDLTMGSCSTCAQAVWMAVLWRMEGWAAGAVTHACI